MPPDPPRVEGPLGLRQMYPPVTLKYLLVQKLIETPGLIKVRIHCLLYLHLAFFYELCDFPQIVRSDAIWGELCEIAPSRNIRWPDYKIKYHRKYSRLCFRLGKTERSPVLWTSESQGAQHIYHFIKKLRFLQSLSLRLQFIPVKIHRRSLAKIAYNKQWKRSSNWKSFSLNRKIDC